MSKLFLSPAPKSFSKSQLSKLFYITYFLIKNTPPAIVTNTTNPNPTYVIALPVSIDNITGASSIFSKLFYITYFLIKNTPPAIVTNTTNPNPTYVIALPVSIDNITGASSISSSPGFLLSGVESLSGTPLSL